MALREIVEMLGANPRKVAASAQVRSLARFDGATQWLPSPEDFLSSLRREQPVLQERPYEWDP